MPVPTKIIFVFLTALVIAEAIFKIDIYEQYPARFGLKKNDTPVPGSNESIVLYKFLDAEYYGKMMIGQPAKEFKMIFDTTWADTWIPSSKCDITEIVCMIHNRYDSTKSSTYQADGRSVNITTDEYSLQGFISRDDFHLPHLKLKNQTFIEMTHISLKTFITQKADGLIGLGFEGISLIDGSPFFYNLRKQNVIKADVFTFYMNRDETTEKAGRLILGGTERKHLKGQLTYMPVVEKKYWKINIDLIMLESAKKTIAITKKINAIMDTSTNEIKGPKADIDRINVLINAKKISPKFGKNLIKCRDYAKLPRVHFILRNRNFTIESKYYVQRMAFESMEICFSPFVASETNDWQLGGAFLMQFYTEYYFDGRIAIGETLF